MGSRPKEITKTGGKMKQFRNWKLIPKDFLFSIFCLLFSVFCSLSSVFGVTTSLWEVRDFKECKLKDAMLDKDGFASLAPKIECIWENPEVYIWTIVKGKDGADASSYPLYVGTGAEGKIYKIEAGKSSMLFDTKEAGVFSIAINKGKIYAGTSPNGKIFVVSEEGKGEIFKETGEKYIWEIVFDENNNLYAGTGTNGKILKITERGEEVQPQLDTFYTTQRMNVSFLAYFKPYFYAGTGEDGLLFKIDRQGKGFCIYDAPEDEITGVIPVDSLLFVSATSDSQGSIYLVYPDNRVEKIWQTNSQVRGIACTGGRVIATAGKRVYRIDRQGNSELIAELPTPISCITNRWIGTSEVGKVYELDSQLSKQGTVESPSYDTKSISRWGRLEYRSVGQGIRFRTRTGNTKDPDPTWDDWKVVGPDYKINSQPARFIQWEAELTSPDARLKEVKIHFLPQNEKPKILELKVAEPKKPKKEKADGEKAGLGDKVVWTAKDPNEDDLIFNLYFKSVEEKEWTLLKESIKDTFYSIDPKSFPDGEYEFRIEANDSPSNPPEYALKSDRISHPYLIDNTPPIIEIGEVKDGMLYFEVEDNHFIKSCEYALDGGEWKVTAPIDDLFDAGVEKFKINIGKAKKVVIRTHDVYGNTTLKSKLIK